MSSLPCNFCKLSENYTKQRKLFLCEFFSVILKLLLAVSQYMKTIHSLILKFELMVTKEYLPINTLYNTSVQRIITSTEIYLCRNYCVIEILADTKSLPEIKGLVLFHFNNVQDTKPAYLSGMQ